MKSKRQAAAHHVSRQISELCLWVPIFTETRRCPFRRNHDIQDIEAIITPRGSDEASDTHTHAETQRGRLCRRAGRFSSTVSVVRQANLNIPMGALRPGAGHPVKRREEAGDTEEVRQHRHAEESKAYIYQQVFKFILTGPNILFQLLVCFFLYTKSCNIFFLVYIHPKTHFSNTTFWLFFFFLKCSLACLSSE